MIPAYIAARCLAWVEGEHEKAAARLGVESDRDGHKRPAADCWCGWSELARLVEAAAFGPENRGAGCCTFHVGGGDPALVCREAAGPGGA